MQIETAAPALQLKFRNNVLKGVAKCTDFFFNVTISGLTLVLFF
jgi:hypothetical protein